MVQRDQFVRWRDKLGRVWDVYQTDDPGVIVWHARSGSVRGKNIANVLTSDSDLKQLSFAFLADIHVDARMEDRGLGSMLLSRAIAACRTRGHEGIESELSEVGSGHFDKLKHFYEKFGFTVTFYSPEAPGYNHRRRGEIRLKF